VGTNCLFITDCENNLNNHNCRYYEDVSVDYSDRFIHELEYIAKALKYGIENVALNMQPLAM